MSPLVSIVTRTKDRPLLLPRACDSVLAQTLHDWEHIIVNDAGDPGPVEEITGARQSRYNGRLRVLHRDCSSGMEAASNAAVRASRGCYVVIHDDDDSWHPRFLEKTTSLLERLGSGHVSQGVATHTIRVVETLSEEGPKEQFRHPFTERLHPIRLWRVLEENAFPPISFLFRRAALEEIGFFDESLPVLGDWDFNVRFLRRFDIAVVPELLACYHHRADATARIYANTVTSQDHLHRATERTLIERWDADPDPAVRALASATRGAREILLRRRSNDSLGQEITNLRAQLAELGIPAS